MLLNITKCHLKIFGFGYTMYSEIIWNLWKYSEKFRWTSCEIKLIMVYCKNHTETRICLWTLAVRNCTFLHWDLLWDFQSAQLQEATHKTAFAPWGKKVSRCIWSSSWWTLFQRLPHRAQSTSNRNSMQSLRLNQ